ncbi:hypothetical protein A2U01_0060621, partial [Trifolium medium]|nr:hypothetical protein [Trifolium medium]
MQGGGFEIENRNPRKRGFENPS